MNAALLYKSKLFYAFAFLLFCSCALSVIQQNIFYLLIPFAAVASLWLWQNFSVAFYILLAVIPWSIEFNVTESLSTDLPDEPLMLFVSAMVVVWILFNYKKIIATIKLHPVAFIVLIQLIWVLITVITSTSSIISLKYLLAKSWYLLAFFVAPLILFKNRSVFKKSVLVLLFSMLAVTVLTLIRHGLNGFTFNNINPSLEPFFRNHVNYSALLVCMLPILWMCIKTSTTKNFKYLFIVLTIITIAAIYFSYSRGAWLAVIISIAVLWIIKKRALFIAYLFALLIMFSTFFWLKNDDRYLKYAHDYNTTVFHTNFSEHLMATYNMQDVSTAERFYRWVAGMQMIKDGWKTGFGPGTFYSNYKYYTIPAFKTWVSNNEDRSTVHNYFLLVLIEQGVIGLLIFLSLLGAFFWYAQKTYLQAKDNFWKLTVAACAAVFTMICVVNFLSDLIETDKVGSIFYLCLATIIVADIKTKNLKPAQENN